jgi:hypothetical protein
MASRKEASVQDNSKGGSSEDTKFAEYWPRNIMILLGPPVRKIIGPLLIVDDVIHKIENTNSCVHVMLRLPSVFTWSLATLGIRQRDTRAKDRGVIEHSTVIYGRYVARSCRSQDAHWPGGTSRDGGRGLGVR